MTRSSSDWLRFLAPAAGLCICAATEPHQPSGFVMCPFKLLTGLPCPFCGMTRSVASLLRLRWAESVEYHVFGPFVLAGLFGWFLFESGRLLGWWKGDWLERLAVRPGIWVSFLAVNSAYTVLRWWGILSSSRL